MSTLPDTNQPLLTIRQSNLRMLEEQCPAGAYAKAVQGRTTPSGAGAKRGTAIHEVFARYVQHLYATGRTTDFERVEDIAADVLRTMPELNFTQRKDVLEQARNIADGYLNVPRHFYGTEEAFSTEIALPSEGYVRITGTLDLLEVDDDEGVATITDAKSNHQIFPDSAVADDFQLLVYAMLVLDNLPSVDSVRVRLWFTRWNIMAPQRSEILVTREDADQLREHLAVRLDAFIFGNLRYEFNPGGWCQYCPRRRPGDCTLYRSYYGTVPPPPQTLRQALRLAHEVVAVEDRREILLPLLKDWVNEHGALTLGSGAKSEVFGFHAHETLEYDVKDVYTFLTEPEIVSQVGRVAFLDALRVDPRGKGFRQLTKILGKSLTSIGAPKVSTRFEHKAVDGD